MKALWVIAGLAALLVIGHVRVTRGADSAGRNLPIVVVVALAILWAGGMAIALRGIARQLSGNTRTRDSEPDV